MALEPQTLQHDGYTFTLSQLPGMRGLKVFSRLARMLGKGASKALGAASSEDAKAAAVLDLLAGVDENDVEFLARELLAPATVKVPDSDKTGPLMPVFDSVFQGRLDLLLRVLVFALQVNYGSFLKGLVGSAVAQAAKPAPVSS